MDFLAKSCMDLAKSRCHFGRGDWGAGGGRGGGGGLCHNEMIGMIILQNNVFSKIRKL